jgi:hypothetical protein
MPPDPSFSNSTYRLFTTSAVSTITHIFLDAPNFWIAAGDKLGIQASYITEGNQLGFYSERIPTSTFAPYTSPDSTRSTHEPTDFNKLGNGNDKLFIYCTLILFFFIPVRLQTLWETEIEDCLETLSGQNPRKNAQSLWLWTCPIDADDI